MKLKWSALYIVSLLVWVRCAEKKSKDKDSVETLNAKTDPRRAKVEAVCGSCHLFVEPDLLDKGTWANGVLPAMGTRLGIYSHNNIQYPSDVGKPNTEGIFPSQAVLTKEEWQNILDYYGTYAPDSVPAQIRTQAYSVGLPMFESEIMKGNQVPPIVSMVKILPNAGFCFYDAATQNLTRISKDGILMASGIFENPLSCMIPYKNGYLVSHIGSIYPSDVWSGAISYIEQSGNRFVEKEVIRKKVERPVQLQIGDLDGDKADDIVVCGFGNNKGDFYWLKKIGTQWKKQPLRNVPGAIRTQLIDLDKDGDLDIITLFAQGLEKLILFTNNGKGSFTQKNLLEFIPVRGSSSFEMKDFNKDGLLDILYTCGDNADNSVVFKNYHGVYIYVGDSKGGFTQRYFYPMNGAYKAVAEDFDGDGDLDIAAISFFADYVHQSHEGFLFFEQKQPFEFYVRSHTDTDIGRWLTMDVGDLDGGKAADIILGNFSIGPTNVPDSIGYKWQRGPVVMTLKNSMNARVKGH